MAAGAGGMEAPKIDFVFKNRLNTLFNFVLPFVLIVPPPFKDLLEATIWVAFSGSLDESSTKLFN